VSLMVAADTNVGGLNALCESIDISVISRLLAHATSRLQFLMHIISCAQFTVLHRLRLLSSRVFVTTHSFHVTWHSKC